MPARVRSLGLKIVLIVMALISWRVGAVAQNEQPDPHQPARIGTRYSLTSTAQADFHDPSAWRLLASNDGKSWTVLDVQTNQYFTARSQRVVHYIRNRQPYNTYRLQIDGKNSADVGVDMGLQLASFEVIGPLVNVPDVNQLQSIVSASAAHPVFGPAEFAFDDDPTTAWCDFGLGTPGGCWLQIHYAFNANVQVTNLSQASLLTHVLAARARLAEGGARILSNLTAQVVGPRQLVGYALTSANDETERDPRDWKLLGSKDDGKTWTTLDGRTNEIFTDRLQRRVFNLTNAPPFRLYRLLISSSMATNSNCQIAEIEPLYADPQSDARYSMIVEANADNPPMEATEMAFDGDYRSKWFTFVPPTPSSPCWLQWQLTPRVEELPVINQRQLDLLAQRQLVGRLLGETNSVKMRIHGYALTSANDYASRDPSNWKLLGSNDGGKSWDVLDSRQHEEFASRAQRRVFSLSQPAVYQAFRFQIDSVVAPGDANCVQLAELELLFDDPQSVAGATVLASSQGENAPVETVCQLFDGDAKTKWLDFATASSNHASWIEWRYVKGSGPRVIDTDRTLAANSLLPSVFQLHLPVTVLFVDPNRALAGVGDGTSFQWLSLDPWPEGLAPGAQVQLNGQLKVKGGSLLVSQAHAEKLEALRDQFFSFGSVTGQISGIFSSPAYCGATLTLPNGSSFTVRLPGDLFPVPPNIACPVKMDGILEDLVVSQGRRAPALIWVAKSEDIGLAPQTDEDWNKLPEYSSRLALPAAVHLRGNWERAGEPGRVYIRSGTNYFELPGPEAPGAGAGLEAVGILTSEDGKLVLRNACFRVAAPAAGETVLTKISDVLQFVNHSTNETAPVKIQGVVTYIDMNVGDFYLQDGDEGLLMSGQLNAGLCSKLSYEGNYVEVQGRAVPGVVFATRFAQVLGKGRWPEPARATWDHLMSGTLDNRWVEVEGAITVMDKQRITITMPGGQLVAWINELDTGSAHSLAGSLARVRGVCSPLVNAHNQRLGVRLLVPYSECIDLLSIAPAKPFDLPLLPLDAVMSADSAVGGAQQRYAKTRGVVTCKQGRLLFLQDQADGLRVTLRDDSDVAPGDMVEVVGMPQPDGFSAKLIQAVVRKTGHAALPHVVPVDFDKVILADLAQNQDATLVTMEATLVNESADATRRTLNLRSEQARQVFSAYLPANDPFESETDVPMGSRLKLQGVFKAIQDKTPDVGQAATSFELYLNSSRDLAVLERPSWWTTRHALEVSGAFGGVLAVGLTWIWLLRKQVRQRTHDLAGKVEELKRSELSLAAEVAERKRLQDEADKAHKKLLAVARQAGMAEVATGILHNVGNVLNSVNVSSTLVMERLRRSHPDGLEKAVALLRQHEAELGTFFKAHEKGQKLLPYLEQLAGHLSTNQAGALEELKDLAKNIQHIKDIVAVQQDCAKFAGLTEKLAVKDLVEDALLMDASSLERHQIKIVRAFDPRTPMVEADRHRILQILVNLIRNAKQACKASGRTDKCLTLGIRPAGPVVQIIVADNGVGIPAENLIRVFNHGFTTRKDGHGFGLHNAALAAKEMRGSLHVASPGSGQGATFTLELPALS